MKEEMIYELGLLLGSILGLAVSGWLFMYGLKKWIRLFKKIKQKNLKNVRL